MSTWGPGSFENDDAMDWVAKLETYADDGPVIDALNLDYSRELQVLIAGRLLKTDCSSDKCWI